ncbi:nucleoporin NUP42-like isoform X2 [Hetaerina americana]|uniref:nucleoporin NUP42-like isoform X2 n=1 Tax=Hetaerina americana TaxID=62018 RepID=UPI003A7F1413
MVVCRYFLQGFCKFGDHCRFQHFQENRGSNQINNYRSHNRTWHAPNHGQPGNANSPVSNYQGAQAGSGSLNPLDLAEAINEDVIAMEEGGQWPLSCYTPSKDFGSFPGFHDTSMEEVRYEAYQAQASGTFDQYVKKIENLIQATRMKWGMLKNPTGQVMSVIMACGQGATAETPSAGLPSFSFAASFNSTTSPVPQQQLQPQSMFSLGGNMAFVPPQSGGSIFSPGASPPPSAVAPNFTFTLGPSSPSFGSTPPPAHASTPSSFGTTQPAFGQSVGLLFGSGAATPDTSSIATTNMQPQAIPSGFFGVQSDATKLGSVFGVNPGQATGSVFGSGTTGFEADPFQPKAEAAQAQSGTPGIYTPLSDLTESERKEFTAVTFTLGCVPLRPPPSKLCV